MSDVATLYTCSECAEVRQFGTCDPADPAYQPLLQCAQCHCATRHSFVKKVVNWGERALVATKGK